MPEHSYEGSFAPFSATPGISQGARAIDGCGLSCRCSSPTRKAFQLDSSHEVVVLNSMNNHGEGRP